MLKTLFKFIKRIIFAICFIYGYNLISASLNMIIPINVITVGLVALLGLPAMLSLIVILVLVF